MAHSQQPRILIVDSRDAAAQGAPNYDSFVVTLKPAICGLKGVRLLYANIGNPEDNQVDLYWLLRVGEFGTPCRTASGSDGRPSVFLSIAPKGSARFTGLRAISKLLPSSSPRRIFTASRWI